MLVLNAPPPTIRPLVEFSHAELVGPIADAAVGTEKEETEIAFPLIPSILSSNRLCLGGGYTNFCPKNTSLLFYVHHMLHMT